MTCNHSRHVGQRIYDQMHLDHMVRLGAALASPSLTWDGMYMEYQ